VIGNEYGCPWQIEAPDGTTVTFNDGGLYWLTDVSGFDSPNIRQNIADLPEDDGAVASQSLLGSRPFTMTGWINAQTAADRNQAMAQLQQAVRGLRADATFRATPSGFPPLQVAGRLDNLRYSKIDNGFYKSFQLACVAANPRMFSQEEHVSSSSTSAGASMGAPFPLVFPVVFGGGSGAAASATLTNEGNMGTPPVIRIYGPVTTPEARNLTVGQSIFVDTTLLIGEYVELDTAARTAVKSDGTNLYGSVRFPDSVWWQLQPGSNDLELRASVTGAGASVTVFWQDAWV